MRVRVRAASVNGFDLSAANGRLKDVMEHRFPVVLGKDLAGTVDAVGPGVTGYQVGDRVYGVVMKPYLGDGSFAEYVTVPTTVGPAALPDSIDFVEAATLGVAGVTAIAAVDAAELKPDHRVLVAGDVLAAVRRVHADGVDAVVHLAGDPHALLAALRPGGRFVSTMIMSPDQLPTEDATVIAVYANPDPATLDRAVGQHVDGISRVHLQDTYPLDQAPAAIAAFTDGTLGKPVITTA